jgi:hypothetical protein
VSENTFDTLDKLRETAEGLDCTLETAEPNELLLDLDEYLGNDSEFLRWRHNFQGVLEIIGEKFGKPYEPSDDKHIDNGPYSFEHWASRSGKLHVRVVLDLHLPVVQALVLQAALGSDPKREVLALFEHRESDSKEDTRSLFRPKP